MIPVIYTFAYLALWFSCYEKKYFEVSGQP